MFAIRPTADGRSEGQTILVTKKRKGILGKIINSILLFLTKIVGGYFAKGDTEVFKTIRFSFKNPLIEDHAIIKFIQHAENQKTCDWGFGKVHEMSAIATDQIDIRDGHFMTTLEISEMAKKEMSNE